MKIIAVIGIVLSCILLFLGVFTDIPSSYIGYARIEEYVGGDAYNYIIESGLRGGKIAGAITQRALFLSTGCLLFWLSLFTFALDHRLTGTHTGKPTKTKRFSFLPVEIIETTPSINHNVVERNETK